LTKLLAAETRRSAHSGKPARIFNLGCGPAVEIQKFLIQDEICNHATFTLLDFNDETIQHTSKILEDVKSKFSRKTKLEIIKKSVHQVLKEEGNPLAHRHKYHLIYCAGVFDYLSDRICKRLMSIFYDMLEPGGLIVATNVDASNPSRNGMEYLLEWHLIHRDTAQLNSLVPDQAPPGTALVSREETGVNIYLEIRKPNES